MTAPLRLNKLTARSVTAKLKAGRHSDGGCLYLKVAESGSRQWIFLYKLHGKQHEVGLGSALIIGPHEARARAAEYRKLLFGGQLTPWRGKRPPRRALAGDEFLATKLPTFRSARHAAQWRVTLGEPCAEIRDMPVNEIDTAAVLRVLDPIWLRTPATAMRLRGRIESILGYATVNAPATIPPGGAAICRPPCRRAAPSTRVATRRWPMLTCPTSSPACRTACQVGLSVLDFDGRAPWRGARHNLG